MENSYEAAYAKVKQDIQEQSLNNLSYDIIDSFGNNLLAIKLNLMEGVLTPLKMVVEKAQQALSSTNTTEILSFAAYCQNAASMIITNVEETKQTVDSMNTDVIGTCRRLTSNLADNSLLKNLDNELMRMTSYTINKEVRGNEYPLGEKETMLIWICQMALNNIKDHSAAKKLNIFIHYNPSSFLLIMNDDGKGFNQKDLPSFKGTGFLNMYTAARWINAKLSVESQLNEGTTISISLESLSN
jgi:signal transduction histidine kinase